MKYEIAEIEEPESASAGERISYHVGMAQHHGRQALAHLMLAGWELAKQKQAVGYGGWKAWCAANLDMSQDTADRYIMFFSKTIGAARNAAQIPFAKKPTAKELAAATVGMEQKSATRAMVDLDIIKRPEGWGGNNRGQGRKPKGDAEVAAELEAVARNEAVLWAAAKGALDTLSRLDAEKDLFNRLAGEHLATVSKLLADLSKRAAEALSKRLEAAK